MFDYSRPGFSKKACKITERSLQNCIPTKNRTFTARTVFESVQNNMSEVEKQSDLNPAVESKESSGTEATTSSPAEVEAEYAHGFKLCIILFAIFMNTFLVSLLYNPMTKVTRNLRVLES